MEEILINPRTSVVTAEVRWFLIKIRSNGEKTFHSINALDN